MPAQVQLNFRRTVHAQFDQNVPTEDFLVKGDIESDYIMNLTNLLKRTLSWHREAASFITVLVRPTIGHPKPGSDQMIKVGRKDAKLTLRYRRKGEKS